MFPRNLKGESALFNCRDRPPRLTVSFEIGRHPVGRGDPLAGVIRWSFGRGDPLVRVGSYGTRNIVVIGIMVLERPTECLVLMICLYV
jgi:hypothetical protein